MALDSIEICLVEDLFDVAHLSRVDGMVISIPYAEQDDPPNMIAVLGIDSKKIPCNIFVFLDAAVSLSCCCFHILGASNKLANTSLTFKS